MAGCTRHRSSGGHIFDRGPPRSMCTASAMPSKLNSRQTASRLARVDEGKPAVGGVTTMCFHDASSKSRRTGSSATFSMRMRSGVPTLTSTSEPLGTVGRTRSRSRASFSSRALARRMAEKSGAAGKFGAESTLPVDGWEGAQVAGALRVPAAAVEEASRQEAPVMRWRAASMSSTVHFFRGAGGIDRSATISRRIAYNTNNFKTQ